MTICVPNKALRKTPQATNTRGIAPILQNSSDVFVDFLWGEKLNKTNRNGESHERNYNS